MALPRSRALIRSTGLLRSSRPTFPSLSYLKHARSITNLDHTEDEPTTHPPPPSDPNSPSNAKEKALSSARNLLNSLLEAEESDQRARSQEEIQAEAKILARELAPSIAKKLARDLIVRKEQEDQFNERERRRRQSEGRHAQSRERRERNWEEEEVKRKRKDRLNAPCRDCGGNSHGLTTLGKRIPCPTTLEKHNGYEMSLTTHPSFITIDSGSSTDTYTYNWLRDHCTCPKCIQESTGQKLHRSGGYYQEMEGRRDLWPEVRIQTKDGMEGIAIDWPSGWIKSSSNLEQRRANLDNDRHSSWYSLEWLKKWSKQGNPYHSSEMFSPVIWDKSTLLSSPTLRLPYSEFMNSDQTLHAGVSQISRYGILVIQGVPTEKTSNTDCSLREVVNRIGEIRNTFYGETWNVKSVKNSKNIAYTDVDLGLHMDLCYFENPPRIQALHCLRNKVIGGSSYFVDSYKAVQTLIKQDYAAYSILRSIPTPFYYDNDGYYYHYSHPTIVGPKLNKKQRDAFVNGGESPRIEAVNYSPPFQAPLKQLSHFLDSPPNDPSSNSASVSESQEPYPASFAVFEKLLDQDEGRYEFTMQEGDLVIFDNRRVLHARRSFKDRPDGPVVEDGDATRWLKGCYLDGDVLRNKLRYLSRKVKEGDVECVESWKPWMKELGMLPSKN